MFKCGFFWCIFSEMRNRLQKKWGGGRNDTIFRVIDAMVDEFAQLVGDTSDMRKLS